MPIDKAIQMIERTHPYVAPRWRRRWRKLILSRRAVSSPYRSPRDHDPELVRHRDWRAS